MPLLQDLTSFESQNVDMNSSGQMSKSKDIDPLPLLSRSDGTVWGLDWRKENDLGNEEESKVGG